jgi:hypothetical protein
MLHALKLARAHLFNGNITVKNFEASYTFSASSIESVLHLGAALTDPSPIGKMKDFFPLKIFTLNNLSRLLDANMISESLYFAPFVFWMESVTNASLSKETRIQLLAFAFHIFMGYFVQSYFSKRAPGITIQKSKNSSALFFANDALIIRSLNSVLVTAFLLKTYPNVALERVGTHVLENFFGSVRLACYSTDSWDRILTAECKAIIRKSIELQYDFHVKIRGRENMCGIKVYEREESPRKDFTIDIPPWKIANVLFQANQTDISIYNQNETSIEEEFSNLKDYLHNISNAEIKKTPKLYEPG